MNRPEDVEAEKIVTNLNTPLNCSSSIILLHKYIGKCTLDNNIVDITTKNGSVQRFTFKIIKKVGQGSFGVVSKILELDSKKEYALKIVNINPRFCYRELEILRQLSHPNIIDLIGHYKAEIVNKTKNETLQSNTCVCIVTPYVKYTMLDAMQDRSTFSKHTKKFYFQALSALAYMHAKNICHRDIKPTNILIDENFDLFLCDLGSAKELKESEQNVSYICSRYYRAPECCLGFTDYDTKIDIWSLGIVFIQFRIEVLLFKKENNEEQISEMQKLLTINREDCAIMKIPYKGTNLGINNYLQSKGVEADLTNVIQNSVVVNPKKRASAIQLLSMKYFADVS